ncbi:MAG: hypothetical protein RL358_1263 [Pseudomonadota bacterium]
MRKIVLDTETTGLYPEQGHRIIEIAAIELHGRQVTTRHFHHYLDPERESMKARRASTVLLGTCCADGQNLPTSRRAF